MQGMTRMYKQGKPIRPLFFAKLVYEPSLPEIFENLNKNKNEIPGFFYSFRPKKRLGVLLLSPGHWKHDQC